MSNGAPFTTYAIRALHGSGEISLNRAAERMAMIGDLLIIATHGSYSKSEFASYDPGIVLVDEHNHPRDPKVAATVPLRRHKNWHMSGSVHVSRNHRLTVCPAAPVLRS